MVASRYVVASGLAGELGQGLGGDRKVGQFGFGFGEVGSGEGSGLAIGTALWAEEPRRKSGRSPEHIESP